MHERESRRVEAGGVVLTRVRCSSGISFARLCALLSRLMVLLLESPSIDVLYRTVEYYEKYVMISPSGDLHTLRAVFYSSLARLLISSAAIYRPVASSSSS